MGEVIPVLSYGREYEEILARMGKRRPSFDETLFEDVSEIIEEVRERGDEAVIEATADFDSVKLASILVGAEERRAALDSIDPDLLSVLREAGQRIEKVNLRFMPESAALEEVEPGIWAGRKVSPLSAAGLWVPCRKGPLASTMLMLAVPARVAGVKEVVAATPPLSDGGVDPVTLAAADVAGVSRVVRGNGVALIAAMAFGTESVPRVEAIFGPGPPAISVAMAYVGMYGVRTGPAMGPSECMIIADGSADAGEAARDLLSECEHGPDSSGVLVTDSRAFAELVQSRLVSIVEELPEPRRGYATGAMADRGMIVVVDDLGRAADLANAYAPEHLQIAVEGEKQGRLLDGIRNAGEILLGQSTPFSGANYAMGITAVLPTGGSARAFSGIDVNSYLKASTLGRVDREALPGLCRIVRALGEAEGFPAHVESCLRKLDGDKK